ncbi:excisionase [Burkholderia sp. Bp8984]|uniref:excisionase n=1 Tax=Burkholderia sp. Bp8984 TaxID=2184549 RepID=UPI000F59EF4D|nr:excisionase [Burkholderia sp. Bp8984]RQS63860.1 excisionase [Burkholderia sp. Bp8984]
MTTAKPKLIPLSVWAEQTFGEYAPHRNTLLSWVKNGKIRPFPKKVGRRYFVTPEAEYIDPVAQKIQRMIDGR